MRCANTSPAAFLIPGGFGTRQETYNANLHDFIRGLPGTTLLTSVCTGSWIYGQMGLLDGLAATNARIRAAMNSPSSSSAKWPVSSR